jgi:transcriptional regulator with XRE-family HTH domain
MDKEGRSSAVASLSRQSALVFHRQAGDRLRRSIAATGLQFVEAARIMGISKSQLGNWMRGDAPIRPFELALFCRATGVTTDFVLLDDPSCLPKRLHSALSEKGV